MLLVALGAAALIAGVPVLVVVGALLLSYLPPVAALVAVVALSAASILRDRSARGEPATDEGMVLRQIAGRVSSGATIRATIADPDADSIPRTARRLAILGRPMSEVGQELSEVLPVSGRAFCAICSFSEQTGAAISSALVVLAERADEATELLRQRRVSLAQARFSAIVVGVVPIVASGGLLALKGIPAPGGPVIVAPMVAGLVLQVIGMIIVFRVSSGAN